MSLQKNNHKRINGLDSRIFAVLIRSRRALSIKQIAKSLDVTWITAKSHIQKLAELNVLIIWKTIRKNRVQINPKFIDHLKLNSVFNEEKILKLNTIKI